MIKRFDRLDIATADLADASRLYEHNFGFSVRRDSSEEATIKIALMDLAKGAQAGMVDAEELKDWSEKSRAITGYDILELMRRTV